MNFLRTYKTEAILVLLSLVVHLFCFAFVIAAHDGNVTDAVRADDGYFEIAQNVLAGNGFSWSTAAPYEPNPLRTPGYIYFLAALLGVTGSAALAAGIQLICASAIPLFGMHIARHITRSPHIGILSGVILALDPTLALLSFQFYTETLFLLLFLPWLILTFKYFEKPNTQIILASAALLGAAILTKTSAQYLPILLLPFILLSFRKIGWQKAAIHGVIYLGVIGLILTPWIIRNERVFGEPGLSAQSSFVLYTNLVPAVLSVAYDTDFALTVSTFLTPEEFKGDAITLRNADAYTREAFAIVSAYPSALAYVAVKSLFTFFTNDGLYALLLRGGYVPWDFLPLLIVARLFWVGITLSAFLGALVYLITERTRVAFLTTLLVAYFALTSTVAAFGTNPRYRLPIDPIIIAFAATGAIYAFGHAQRFIEKYKRRYMGS